MKCDRLLLLMTTGLAFACAEDVDSESIRTSGMYANYEAVAHGDGETDIIAEIRVGGDDGTFVELTGEDELTAMTEDDDVVLRHHEQGNRHSYRGTLDGDEEGMEIQIALTRGGEDDDAVDSYATLPAPFEAELEDPDEDEIQRGTDVKIVWDNEGSGSMKWYVQGDCVKPDNGSADDDGSLSIAAKDIDVWESDKGESCEVKVILDRVSQGETDSEMGEGGKFLAIQRREVTFTSTPADDEAED